MNCDSKITITKMFIGGLIPGSDSGKVEEAWSFVPKGPLCGAFASTLTVVSFRFLNLNENHLQESRGFCSPRRNFLERQKVTRKN